ncbi:mannosyltransferase putative-domain-containing protein [Xylariales sp. AK1849]|nr:mannosyltransferase putative-domain-containing protein [Xylariales sp. AK1849]
MARLLRAMRTRPSPRSLTVLTLLFLTVLLLSSPRTRTFLARGPQQEPSGPDHTRWPPNLPPVDETAAYWADTPLSGSFEAQSIEIGQRAGTLREWIRSHDSYSEAFHPKLHPEAIENAAVTLFPFLAHTLRNSDGKNLLENLQPFFNKSSRGIVIPTSVSTLRQTFHLLGALTEVLQTDLPIQIVYGGNDGLRSFQREMLAYRFPNISFLDINTLIGDDSLQLDTSDSALKIFAGLATTFEQFILLDENVVFLQRPDILFEQRLYHSTGALLFGRRTRSSTKSPEFYQREVLRSHSSSEWIRDSLVEDTQYSQEKDSSVVVLDKSRLDVLVGLLHASWQTKLKEGRLVDGIASDRESEVWRLAFELTDSPHNLQTPSDAVIGWPRHEGGDDICSFANGYAEENGKLLWYSSRLLRNDESSFENQNVPTHRMVILSGQEALDNKDILCAVRRRAEALTSAQQRIVQQTVQKARQLDSEFGLAKIHKSLTSSDT